MQLVPPWTIWVSLLGQRSLGRVAVGPNAEGKSQQEPSTRGGPLKLKVGGITNGEAINSDGFGDS